MGRKKIMELGRWGWGGEIRLTERKRTQVDAVRTQVSNGNEDIFIENDGA